MACTLACSMGLTSMQQQGGQAARVEGATKLQPGATYTLRKVFSEAEVRAFLAATGDANPLHVDAAAAAARGFAGPILPGILMASLFPAIIGTAFPGVLYATQSLSFRSPALLGQEVEAQVCVTKRSGSRVTFSTRCVLVHPTRDAMAGTSSGSTGAAGLNGDSSSAPAVAAAGDPGQGVVKARLLVDGIAMAILPDPRAAE
eukprot:CAMPEP_0202880370 /NCGR_PEP_ID=MMETSP1391-20130828/34991_1 /ASSEMBLY_ACC=CAM_ASM_000867 /TAXON_ID=1034604 /ORGANISM="Chlamydomonas leiostraca, Strain SAG 11-49" /LENGTH=201 /DNA_ID=CAMNT_0049562869 /DNA_START=58 /DNA_END=664 /DNA_ORIENTATION=-